MELESAMAIDWKKNKKLKPQSILNSIDAIKTISEDGRVAFSGMDLHSGMAALKTAIDFPAELGDMDKDRLIFLSISDVAKTGPLTSKTLMTAINAQAKLEKKTRPSEFHILTDISVKTPFPNKLITIDSCTIEFFDTEYPDKFQDRNATIEDASFERKPNTGNYKKIIITVKAKSPALAMTKGLRVLDIQRAIWCFLSNFDMQLRENEWKPINRIRLGQIHTVHASNGVAATSIVWYEPNFTEAILFSPDDEARFEVNCNDLLIPLFNSKYSSKLVDALIRYVRALDERDSNVAMIKLWGALEGLAAPGEPNADSVSKRCSSLILRDTAYHEQILEHLRAYRNQSVHAGDQSDSAKIQCFQLQFYFRKLVLFHLREAETFDTLDEANQFLDVLHLGKAKLNRRKEQTEKALAFIG